MFAIAPPEGATFVTPGGPVGQPWLALSPDGRVLAFVAVSADGRQQLWTRPLATTSAHPLPGTDGAQAPFWSPDSRSLAFFARGKLKVVDAAGGTPQIVTDAPGYFGSGSWNRENTIVFASSPRNEGLRSVQVGAAQASQTVTRIDPGEGTARALLAAISARRPPLSLRRGRRCRRWRGGNLGRLARRRRTALAPARRIRGALRGARVSPVQTRPARRAAD